MSCKCLNGSINADSASKEQNWMVKIELFIEDLGIFIINKRSVTCYVCCAGSSTSCFHVISKF